MCSYLRIYSMKNLSPIIYTRSYTQQISAYNEDLYVKHDLLELAIVRR